MLSLQKYDVYKDKDGSIKQSLLNKDNTPRGFRIKVTAAPEPNAIMWENLEVRGWNKCLRQVLTIAISVLAIFISVLGITIFKNMRDVVLSSTGPNTNICPPSVRVLFCFLLPKRTNYNCIVGKGKLCAKTCSFIM